MNKDLEYVRNQITKLKDDLQHYTMVEKDSALASQIRYDLEQFEAIEKELKALEIIKEKQVDVRMFIIYDLENYNKLQKNDYCKLTKAENDLLNEVLLCH